MHRLCSTSTLRRIAPVALAAVLLAATATAAVGQFDAVAEVQMVNISEDQLGQMVFGSSVWQRGVPAAQAPLELQIALVERIGNLSDEQEEKLRLAGIGDIHRFFGRFETLRRKTPTGQVTMEQYQKIWQEAQPLQMRFRAGLHGRGSLFQRTLQNTLDEDQLAEFRRIEEERRRRKYGAIVRATVAQIERAVPLTADQRTRLIDLVLTRTEPPEVYGESQYQVVLLNMSKLPEEELRPMFLDNEWKVIDALLRQGQIAEAQLRQAQELDDE